MYGIKHGMILILLTAAGSFAAADRGNLVAESLLNQAGLTSNWQVQLPLSGGETLEKLYVFEDYLYAMTSRNFFFSIERQTGAVRSMMPLALPELPIQPPLGYEHRSLFLIGQELKVFNPATGVIERVVQLEHLGSNYGGIARNSKYAYVCGSDRRMYVFNVDKGVMAFMASADNDSVIYSVIASEEAVWFGTRAGNIVAMETDSAQRIWQYNLTGGMVIPLIKEGEFLYAGGLDTKVFKIAADSGKEAWPRPFFAGDKIEYPLTLGKTCIYVYAANSGVYAVDKQTGKEIWNVPKGRAVVAEKEGLAYVYIAPGLLAVMDNVSGKQQLSINVAAASRYAVNTTDSSIYLADAAGLIQSATESK